MTQLATALGVTRQTLYNWRLRDPDFPPAQRRPGSTRDEWPLGVMRAYWASRDLNPGERTDLKRPEAGE